MARIPSPLDPASQSQAAPPTLEALERRLVRPAWEPWLFFPLSRDWRWLSWGEALAVVRQWATALVDGKGGLVVERRAPEALLVSLAAGFVGRPCRLVVGDEQDIAQRLSWNAGRSGRAGAPTLSIGIKEASSPDVVSEGVSEDRPWPFGRAAEPAPASVLVSLEHGMQLASGAALLGDPGSVLLLEPSDRAMLASLYWLRPEATVLLASAAERLWDQLQQPRRAERRLCQRLRDVLVVGDWSQEQERLGHAPEAPIFRQIGGGWD